MSTCIALSLIWLMPDAAAALRLAEPVELMKLPKDSVELPPRKRRRRPAAAPAAREAGARAGLSRKRGQ